MLLNVIYDLKDIGAEHLLQNKCQPYAEGVESALGEYNSMVLLVPLSDIELIEMKVKMKLALAYADKETAENYAEEVFQLGKIDFFEYILDCYRIKK